MEYVSVAVFRANSKKYLEELPIMLTVHGKPVAKINAVELNVVDRTAPICQMGILSAKLPCTNNSNGKYSVKLHTAEDDKSWDLFLCKDHVKIIESKDNMEIEKV